MNDKLITLDNLEKFKENIEAEIPTVADTYSSTSSVAMSGKAIASAISGKADSSALGTQVTYTLSGTTLYINTK